MKRLTLTLISSMLLSVAAYAQTYSPVAVTGFNVDGIAEDTMAITHTSQALDGSDYILYTQNYGTRYGISAGMPDNGTVLSGTRTYQLEPYSQNNILFLLQGATDSLILTTPASFEKLSMLGTSTEGPGTNTYSVRFTDGSSTTFSNIALNDWFNGSNPILSGINRAGRGLGTIDVQAANPRLYANDLTLTCADQAKLVSAIVVSNVGTHPRTCIFAVSAVSVPTYSITSTAPSCNGGLGRAFITPSGGAGPYSYTWSSSPVQHSDTATGLASGYYTVTASDAAHCSVVLYDTLAQPAGSILTITASADSLCPGAAVTLTTTGANSYAWSVGSSTDSFIVVQPYLVTTYSVIGTGTGGCVGAGSLTVNVRPTPPVHISVTPYRFACVGNTITLSGTGASSYAWDHGITDGVGFIAIAAAMTTYTVTGTDGHGCVAMDSLNVYIHTPPTVSASASSDSACAGASISLRGAGALGYVWSGGQLDRIAFPAPTATTTYSVTGSDSYGCSGTASVQVYVKTSPTVGTTASPNDTVCTGSSLTLSGTGAASYTWSGGVSNGTAFVPASSTSYTVTGTAANGCTNTATVDITVRNCLGIDETGHEIAMSLYPNPNNGSFTISSGADIKDLNITLTDIRGLVVYTAILSDLRAGETRQVSMGNTAAGIYLMRLQTGSQQQVEKIVIER